MGEGWGHYILKVKKLSPVTGQLGQKLAFAVFPCCWLLNKERTDLKNIMVPGTCLGSCQESGPLIPGMLSQQSRKQGQGQSTGGGLCFSPDTFRAKLCFIDLIFQHVERQSSSLCPKGTLIVWPWSG